MNRWMVALATLAFSFSLSPKSAPRSALSGFIFEGRVTGLDGNPVPGAEIRLVDSSGVFTRHAFSDMGGRYRLPIAFVPKAASPAFCIEISHALYQAVNVEDALRGAAIGPPGLASATPDRPFAPLAAARRVTRDFVLTPMRGTPSHPMAGPMDWNYAEHCYGRAHQLLNENKEKEAVALLKIYAQIGGNSRQVARSIELLNEYDR